MSNLFIHVFHEKKKNFVWNQNLSLALNAPSYVYIHHVEKVFLLLHMMMILLSWIMYHHHWLSFWRKGKIYVYAIRNHFNGNLNHDRRSKILCSLSHFYGSLQSTCKRINLTQSISLQWNVSKGKVSVIILFNLLLIISEICYFCAAKSMSGEFYSIDQPSCSQHDNVNNLTYMCCLLSNGCRGLPLGCMSDCLWEMKISFSSIIFLIITTSRR